MSRAAQHALKESGFGSCHLSSPVLHVHSETEDFTLDALLRGEVGCVAPVPSTGLCSAWSVAKIMAC